LERLREEGRPIEPDWTMEQVETKTRELINKQPLKTLLKPDSKGVFYPYSSCSLRHETESTAFLTPRGGQSKRRRTRGQERKTSKPILLKSNGDTIKPNELWNANFQRTTLFEMRNHVNVFAVEKRLQQIIANEVSP